MLEKTKL
ncbi:39b368d3-1f32-4502-a2fe-ca568b2b4e16 [Thermothielavioides terrestris]|nr:39b368d3-1f32-4502-a2fe-ca568b2b4e16 [Thermothielavioides terrestris]